MSQMMLECMISGFIIQWTKKLRMSSQNDDTNDLEKAPIIFFKTFVGKNLLK